MADSRILDPRTGEPFKLSQINSDPQTSRVGSLHREFANHPSRGLTPPKLAAILEAAEQGDMLAQCDLFDDMEEKDAHIFAEMQKRKLAIQGLDWDIRPPRNASAQEERAADLAREIVTDMDGFEDVLLDMASAIGHGFSCLEYEGWELSGRERLPGKLSFRPHRWFTVDQETRSELRLRSASVDGDQLQPFGWIVHRHASRSGYVTRSGLHRVLSWPFLFKNYSVRDLAEFLEIYGLPLRIGTYPTGASDPEKATLLRAVVGIGHAAAGIVPEGMKIDFKDAAKGGSDPFEVMIKWCEGSESKAILGGTLTSGTGDGTNTNALGNVHNEVRHDLLVADARQIASTLTRDLIFPIVTLNTSGIDSLRRCPRFVFDTSEPDDTNTLAERDSKIYSMGFDLTEEYVQETYGDGFVKRPAPTLAKLRTAITALKADTIPQNDVVDEQLVRLQKEADTPVEEWIGTIEKLLDEVGSLEELRDRLLESYPDMKPEKFASVMQEAMSAAHMAGRYDVTTGN